MNARSKLKLVQTVSTVTLAMLAAFGFARTARASDDDPFADTSDQPAAKGSAKAGKKPAADKSDDKADDKSGDEAEDGSDDKSDAVAPEKPQSSNASPAAPSPSPGVVEELPGEAYPESDTRGLYGGSLWLNMQGIQWPYMPHGGIGISGYGWLDTDYKLTRIGDPNQSPHTTKLFQQGRFLLRVTPTYTNGTWFVQAQAEIVADKDQLDTQPNVVNADDVWVRTGNWNQWDVTVGRFEAFEVYHLGMGLDINTDERIGAYDGTNTASSVPQVYGASYLFYRPAGPGNIALHLYPTHPLRLELLTQWGNDNTLNYVGARPAAILDLGMVKLKAAAEYQLGTAQDPGTNFKNDHKNRGAAGSVQVVLSPWVELGLNVGYKRFDVTDAKSQGMLDLEASGDETSLGAFLNFRPFTDTLVGLGGNYASQHDRHMNANTGSYDHSTNTQGFLAIQYLVNHQLFIKLVGGYAKSHFENALSNNPYDDDLISARLRVMYLF